MLRIELSAQWAGRMGDRSGRRSAQVRVEQRLSGSIMRAVQAAPYGRSASRFDRGLICLAAVFVMGLVCPFQTLKGAGFFLVGLLLPWSPGEIPSLTRTTCIADRFFIGGPSSLRGFKFKVGSHWGVRFRCAQHARPSVVTSGGAHVHWRRCIASCRLATARTSLAPRRAGRGPHRHTAATRTAAAGRGVPAAEARCAGRRCLRLRVCRGRSQGARALWQAAPEGGTSVHERGSNSWETMSSSICNKRISMRQRKRLPHGAIHSTKGLDVYSTAVPALHRTRQIVS